MEFTINNSEVFAVLIPLSVTSQDVHHAKKRGSAYFPRLGHPEYAVETIADKINCQFS